MDDQKMKRYLSREEDSGFLWFFETSWSYISPKGVREITSFICRFPSAWFGFRKLIKPKAS